MFILAGDGHFYLENTMPEQQQQEEPQSGKSILLGIIGFLVGMVALMIIIQHLMS